MDDSECARMHPYTAGQPRHVVIEDPPARLLRGGRMVTTGMTIDPEQQMLGELECTSY